jgi:hypothetical protein
MSDTISIEGFGWTKSVHQTFTEKQFVDMYSGDGYDHIYPYMSKEQKKAALKLAYKACVPTPIKAPKREVFGTDEE